MATVIPVRMLRRVRLLLRKRRLVVTARCKTVLLENCVLFRRPPACNKQVLRSVRAGIVYQVMNANQILRKVLLVRFLGLITALFIQFMALEII